MRQELKLKILTEVKAIIAHGFCTGAYAKRASSGHPGAQQEHCGVHCINAVEHDLAGALWVACEYVSYMQREALFGTVWSELMHSEGFTKSVEFIKHLDSKSQSWHLEMLDRAINPTVIVIAPKVNGKRAAIEQARRLALEYV